MGATLIIGSTGVLGSEICRRLVEQGQPVRALVRRSSDPPKVERLRAAGIDVVEADLKDAASLTDACRDVRRIVFTASATLSRSTGDSIETVDRDGGLNAVAAARTAGVEQFVLVSFPPTPIRFPLQDAKRAVEAALRASGVPHTILQPTHFWEIWCNPALGFDAQARQARVFGDGTAPMSWISFLDVASAAVRSLGNPNATDQTFQLGGPAPLSQLDIVRVFEAAGGKPFEREHVPIDALRAQHESSTDSLQQSFAALMRIVAEGGWVFDSGAARQALNIEMTPIEAFARHAYGVSA